MRALTYSTEFSPINAVLLTFRSLLHIYNSDLIKYYSTNKILKNSTKHTYNQASIVLQKYILNSSIKMPIAFNVLICGINNSLLEITCALINNLFTIYLHMIILQSQGIILFYICIYFLLKLTYKTIFFNFIIYYTFILPYYI